MVDPKKFVDEKNRALYESLIDRKYKIELKLEEQQPFCGQQPAWECKCVDRDKKQATIIYPNEEPKTFGYYTHELFHIDLVDRGFLTNDELGKILPESFTDYFPLVIINNIIAHQRFYKDFLDLGYSPEEFIVDYDPDSVDVINGEIGKTKGEFETLAGRKEAMCDFVQYYFAYAFYEEDISKYTKALQDLRKVDETLYPILEKNWTEWKASNSLDNLTFFEKLSAGIDQWRGFWDTSK